MEFLCDLENLEKLISALDFRAHRDIRYVLDAMIDFIKNDCLDDLWMTPRSLMTSSAIQKLIDPVLKTGKPGYDAQFKGCWAAHIMFSLVR